jgi:uncharacterized protein YbjT (DUF2867 family)
MASKNLLVIGGTGAQGAAVVRHLALSQDTYNIKVLTRNARSREALELLSLNSPKSAVSLIEGDCFNETDLHAAFAGIDATFVNTNGFATGAKGEIFWSIRIYEIAQWAGVKHFVYSGLSYVSKLAGFDPRYRCGHKDAKGQFGGESLPSPSQ